jgi:hypothetical protein
MPRFLMATEALDDTSRPARRLYSPVPLSPGSERTPCGAVVGQAVRGLSAPAPREPPHRPNEPELTDSVRDLGSPLRLEM